MISRPSLSTFLWRYVLALVLASTLTAAGLVGGTGYLQHKLNQAGEVNVDLARSFPGAANFLILGSDTRAFVEDDTDRESFGSPEEVGGQRADAIIVARVEPATNRGLIVSFPRDLLVRHPGRGGLHRINEAFGDGPQGVIDVMAENFGVPVHHYVELDFAGFRRMVDAIGGVRMYIPSPVRDRKTGLDVPEPGCVTLDGVQALAWVRSRNFSYLEAGTWRTDPSADLGRIERQQEFIRRLMSQAVHRGALNPLRANRLVDAALDNLTVDSTFDGRDALRLVQAFRTSGPAAVEMVALPTRPAGAALRVKEEEAEPILARLRSERAGDAAGPAVAPSSVRLRVLNGTGAAGLAGDTTARLAGVGFATSTPGDADRFSYRTTEIRYLPPSRAKAELVSSYLKGAGRLVPDPGLRNLDVVLVVGDDFDGVAARPAPAPPTTGAPVSPTAGPPPAGPAPDPAGAPARPAC